jgi:hypothetical protein
MPADLLARPDGGAPAFRDLRRRIQADIIAGLPAHFRRMGMAPEQLHDWQRDRLRRLLSAAVQRSGFHASGCVASTRHGSSSPTCRACRS